MKLILILVILFLILWKLHSRIEPFQPAWNDFVLYAQLSRRPRVGTWKGYININGLVANVELQKYCNFDLILYNSTDQLIDDLLIHKKIDAGYVTEADYGIYISNKIREKDNVQLFNREYINKNKETILQNFTARRLYSFYKMYRFFIVDNFKIRQPSDIAGKVLQITNLTNSLYLLDLDLLRDVDYIKVYKNEDRSLSKYGSINSLGLQIDGYFTQYDYPNEDMKELSYNKNMTILDLYSDHKTNKNPFTKPNIILDKYFYLTKDKMDIRAYPEIRERRKERIALNNLPYKPETVNCYSFKVFLLSREDVNNEMIYLFTKSIMEHIHKIMEGMHRPDVNENEMFLNSLNDILPVHPALYNPKKYPTE
jgi:TRAP-type uncharacterized transport system substrate-binding protein